MPTCHIARPRKQIQCTCSACWSWGFCAIIVSMMAGSSAIWETICRCWWCCKVISQIDDDDDDDDRQDGGRGHGGGEVVESEPSCVFPLFQSTVRAHTTGPRDRHTGCSGGPLFPCASEKGKQRKCFVPPGEFLTGLNPNAVTSSTQCIGSKGSSPLAIIRLVATVRQRYL